MGMLGEGGWGTLECAGGPARELRPGLAPRALPHQGMPPAGPLHCTPSMHTGECTEHRGGRDRAARPLPGSLVDKQTSAPSGGGLAVSDPRAPAQKWLERGGQAAEPESRAVQRSTRGCGRGPTIRLLNIRLGFLSQLGLLLSVPFQERFHVLGHWGANRG